MKTKFKFSSIARVSFVLVAFFAISNGLKAQTATITNNTDCAVEVVLFGIDDNCVGCIHNGGAVTTVAGSGGSVPVPIFGLLCDITHGVRAFVQGVNGAPVQVRTMSCMGSCTGNDILSNTMTFPAGQCYSAPTTATVTITCAGANINIEVNN